MESAPKQLLYPPLLHLEASTVCQLRCPSCPTAAGKVRQALGAGFLKFCDFQRIVDENPWLARIELSNWGEVFLNPELGAMVRYAYRRNVDLRASGGANLNTITEDMLETLVRYRFRTITCSIDGASPETYSQYRRNGNFEHVIQNIRTINRFKRQYRSPYPALRWQYVAFGHNEHEIGHARQMARDLDMTFTVKLSWEDLYLEASSPIRDAELIRRESGLGVANRREYREKYGRAYLNHCVGLWTSPQINYDGRVLGCTVNYWGDYGNAFQEGLGACLTNERMNGAREALMGRRALAEDTPCARCRVYRGRQENKDWVTPADLEGGSVPRRIYILLENKVLGPRVKRQLSRLRGRMRRAWGQQVMALPPVASKIYPLQIPLPVDPHEGWRPFPVFRVATAGIQDFSCHASVLLPNHCPHPPHRHREEELLLVLSGQVDVVLPAVADRQGNTRHRLQAGELVYYPRHFAHTLQTQGSSPAHYLMFKWHTVVRKKSQGRGFGRFDLGPSGADPQSAAGLCIRGIFAGPTAYLNNLQCHCSTLAPHAGYAPHTDAYDVAIVVLDGQVETLGQRATPYHVIFYAAGEPHGMHNPGEKAARYLVVEFHARKPPWRQRATAALRRMARNLMHPRRSISKTISLVRTRTHDVV